MKYLFIICLLLPSICIAEDVETLVPLDKVAHFGLAGTAQAVCSGVMTKITKNKNGSILGCFVAINVAGLAKELTDKQRGGDRDPKDALANALGSGLVGLTLYFGF